MVDFHTHVLPYMDDGSGSLGESNQMLKELSRQGVSTVIATSHYYADKEKPSEFNARREASLSLLQNVKEASVNIIPGAEVYYYPGISLTKELPMMAIRSTNLFLLEMPFSDWTPSVVNEVYSIQRNGRIQVVLAHIDRYWSHKNNKYIEEMHNCGVLFQINSNAFLDKKRRGDALKMLKNKEIQFIGTDCHNMTSRPPRLQEALEVIEDKLGARYVEYLNDKSQEYLG